MLTIINGYSQNVGITDNSDIAPQSLLHVHGLSAGQLFQLTSANTTGGNTPTANSGFNLGIDISMNVSFNQREFADMLFLTNNITRLKIDASGVFRLYGDFYNQETNASQSAVALGSNPDVLVAAATIIYRTGSSIIVSAFYSGENTAGSSVAQVRLKITRQDGAGPETDITYAASTSVKGAGYGVCVNLYWKDSGLTDGNTITYKLYRAFVLGGLSSINYSLITTMIKD